MLGSREYAERMQRPYRIDRGYELPYVAGYSITGDVVYIDKHVDTMLDGIDTEKYIVCHERTEKALIDLFRLDYQQAHHIASSVERAAVVDAGIDYAKYDAYYKLYIKGLSIETMKYAPHDLDLTPYRDEDDFRKVVSAAKYHVR
jgi:hypothetical protein